MTPDQLRTLIEKDYRSGVEELGAAYKLIQVAPALLRLWEAALNSRRWQYDRKSVDAESEALTALEESA